MLLDLVRGLAALVVLAEHWRHTLFVDYSAIAAHRGWFMLPYLVSSTGHQAVVIFFVLSGYLIAGSVFRLLERGTWSWRRYGLQRGLRLWIVVVPGLVLGALWDRLGLGLHLAPALYGGFSASHLLPDVRATGTVLDFVRNLFFLQEIAGPTFGSNGALWSLAFEFWYYVLFPLGLLTLLRGRPAWQRALCAVLFVAVALFVGRRLMESFPVWLAGAVLARVPVRTLPAWVRWAASAVYVPAFFLIAPVANHFELAHPWVGLFSDYALTVLTFAWLWTLLGATGAAEGTTGEHAARGLSRFSFTLYVAHTPLLILLMAAAAGDARWQPDPLHLAFGTGMLAVVLGYAWGLAWLTEFRTDRVRAAVERRLGLGPARAVPLDRVHVADR